MKKRTLSLFLAGAMVLSLAACTPKEPEETKTAGSYTPGTYTATVSGMHGPMTVEVTVTEDRIENVNVTENVETPGLVDWPVRLIPERVVEAQSLAVDTVTGVTISSRAILNGVETALKGAGMDVTALKQPIEKTPAEDAEYTADVIIVGGGGAGLSAAIAATDEGSSVVLIEKTGFLGGNSIVAGGIYNCPDPDLQDNAQFSGNVNSLVEDALAEWENRQESPERSGCVPGSAFVTANSPRFIAASAQPRPPPVNIA